MPFIADGQAMPVKRGFKPDKGKSIGGFVENIGKSAINTVGGIGSSLINVFNPNMEKNTVANLGRLGVGAAQLLDPTQILGTGQEETARNVGRFYDNRYGISDALGGRFGKAGEKIGNTLYNDPVGAALDISTVVGGAGALAKGVGSASKVAGLTRAGEALGTAASFIDPFQLVGKGAGAATRGLSGKLASGLDAASEGVVTRGLGNPRQLAKAEVVAGMSPGKLMNKYNVFDRSAESLGEAASGINAQRTGMLGEAVQAGSSANVRGIIKSFDKQIAELQELGKTSEKAAAQAAELARRKTMFMQSLATNQNTPILQKINEIKSSFQSDIAPSTFGMPTQEIGKVGGTTDAYRTLLGGLEESVPGIRQMGREESAFYKLRDAAKSAEARGAARNPLSLGKMVSGGAGSMVAGLPGMATGMVLESIGNSPMATKIASKGLSGAANAVRGAKLPPVVGKVGSGLYNAGNAGRMINAPSDQSQSNQSPSQLRPQVIKQSYPAIVPPTLKPPTPPPAIGFGRGSNAKPLKFTMPKNTFKSGAAFGGSKRVKAGNFT